MAQFKAFAPDVEVAGAAVLSVLDGMGSYKSLALKLLSDVGIVNPRPGFWYPQQAWLDAFRKIHDSVGESVLFAIGTKIPSNAKFPREIDGIEKALASIDVAYHMNHRIDQTPLFDPATGTMLEGIGHYGYEKTDEKRVKMVCGNPYPCDLDQGIIDAMARSFKPSGSLFIKVKHDDDEPCRKKGADACTYWVTW